MLINTSFDINFKRFCRKCKIAGENDEKSKHYIQILVSSAEYETFVRLMKIMRPIAQSRQLQKADEKQSSRPSRSTKSSKGECTWIPRVIANCECSGWLCSWCGVVWSQRRTTWRWRTSPQPTLRVWRDAPPRVAKEKTTTKTTRKAARSNGALDAGRHKKRGYDTAVVCVMDSLISGKYVITNEV